MSLRDRLRFVSLPPAPRGTLRSPWLALVYPASARMLSQPYTAALHSAPLAIPLPSWPQLAAPEWAPRSLHNHWQHPPDSLESP